MAQPLDMAMLVHRQAVDGDHYDLLFRDPEGEAGLLTWRLAEPTWRWCEVGVLEAVAIQRHRDHYLSYEGPLTGGRGTVERVDAGQVWAVDWATNRGMLRFKTERFLGQVRLKRIEGASWQLVVMAEGE